MEIEAGAGPVESGAGFMIFGCACARADGVTANTSNNKGAMRLNIFVGRFTVVLPASRYKRRILTLPFANEPQRRRHSNI